MSFYKFRGANFYKFLIPTLILLFLLQSFVVFAQLSPEQERAQLEQELKELEERIAQFDKDITRTEQEKRTLQNQIASIRSRISQLDLQIKRSSIIIQDLGLQIQDTEGSIESTTLNIEDERQKLSQVLKTIYEEDQKSLLEVLLTERSLSVFFDNLMALETLNQRNHELLQDIKGLKLNLEEQKEKLDTEKESLTRQVKAQTLQKQETEAARKEQERLLKMTEVQYQQYVQQKKLTEQKAAEIRARLFQLAGIPDVEAPTFGEALQMAQWVQQKTGVRPAFLLSIITQESALARNVGQCYIADTTSGASVDINNGRRFSNGIHRTRDLPKFLQITQEVGRDPLKTPVSCPLSYGYGGAMGPAQFIPSTWLLIKNQVSSILGQVPNPWSIRDSFLSAGVLLKENGASASELKAAARYFGAAGLGYESAVMRRATCLETFISQGTLSAQCERLVFAPQ